MIKYKNGLLEASRLDDTGCLKENFMKKYDYISMKKDFDNVVDTLAMNKVVHSMYEELLDYKVDENLEFIIICKDPRSDKRDTQLLTLERVYYDNCIEACEELLCKFKSSWNKLNEVERYIIKSLYFDEIILSDEEITYKLLTYKNKYNLYKKSAYIKMDSALRLNDPLIKDQLDRQLIDTFKVITFNKCKQTSSLIKNDILSNKI